jgi:hypothetical protein
LSEKFERRIYMTRITRLKFFALASALLWALQRPTLAAVSDDANQPSDPGELRIPNLVLDFRFNVVRPKPQTFDFRPLDNFWRACAGPSCANRSDLPYKPFVNGGGVGFNVGARPKFAHQMLQIDVGYDFAPDVYPGVKKGILVNAKNGQTIGTATAVSRLDFLTAGGRFVLPLFNNNLLLSVGGGTNRSRLHDALLEASVKVCEICSETRAGWGKYGIGEVTVFVHTDKKEDMRVGLSFNVRTVNANLNAGGNTIQWGNTSQRIVVFGAAMSLQGFVR